MQTRCYSSSLSSSAWFDGVTSLVSKIPDNSGGDPRPALPMDDGSAGEIITSRHSIRTDHLQRLLSHDALAIHVKGFYRPKEIAAGLGAFLARQAREGKARNWKVMRQEQRGMESTDVMTIGEHDPYNVAVAQGATRDYFDSVRKEFARRRRPVRLPELLSTHDDRGIEGSEFPVNPVSVLWPLDQVRLELDEAWPGGAGLARNESEGQGLSSHCFGGGLPRIMMGPTRWKRGLVHVDQFSPLSESQGLFSANIYLQLPEGGLSQSKETSKNHQSLPPKNGISASVKNLTELLFESVIQLA